MKPALRAALAATLLAGVSAYAANVAEKRALKRAAVPAGAATAAPNLVAHCPPQSLPEGGICVPVPKIAEAADAGDDASDPAIPRTPERPAAIGAYELPIVAEALAQGALERAVVRGARVEITGIREADVRSMKLDGQTGPTRVAFAGDLDGAQVVITRHELAGAAGPRVALVVHRGIGRVSQGVGTGGLLDEGQSLGALAWDPRRGASVLGLETRVVRAGVRADELAPARMTSPGSTVATDPRNVLARAAGRDQAGVGGAAP